jgi:hypothetical protein
MPVPSSRIRVALQRALVGAPPPYTPAQVDEAIMCIRMGMDAAREHPDPARAQPFIDHCQWEVDLLEAFRAGLAQAEGAFHGNR